MTSFTSLSDRRVPWRALGLVLVGLVVWAGSAAYTLRLNPEIRFYRQVARLQDEWSARMTRDYTNKVVFVGGSSCLFAVDAQRLLHEHQLPAVNRGLAAGMGLTVPAFHALQDLRQGDTLVLAFEPAHLTQPVELTSTAVQFSHAVGHPEWVTQGRFGAPAISPNSARLMLRPGSHHVITLLGKLLQGRSLYRYSIADARPDGGMATSLRLTVQGPPGHGAVLSPDARAFVTALRDWCLDQGIRVAYALPWAYCPAEALEEFRQQNARFLLELSTVLPVLKEPGLGSDSNPEHFADTAWHLTAEAARLRTDDLGRVVRHWEMWNPDELRALAKTKD